MVDTRGRVAGGRWQVAGWIEVKEEADAQQKAGYDKSLDALQERDESRTIS